MALCLSITIVALVFIVLSTCPLADSSDGSSPDVNEIGFSFDYIDVVPFRFKVSQPDPDAGGDGLGKVVALKEYTYYGEVHFPEVVTFVHDGVTYSYSMVGLGQSVQYQWDLEVLYLPKTIEEFSETDMDGCSSLRAVYVDPGCSTFRSFDGLVYKHLGNDEYELSYCPSMVPSVLEMRPDFKVTSIGEYAIEGCSQLTTIIIPYGVRSLSDNSVTVCPILGVVRIPSTVEFISECAFHSNSSLTEIDIDPMNQYYVFEDFMLLNKDKTLLLKYFDSESNLSCAIPDTVKRISRTAFYWSVNLEKLSIPDSVEYIEELAFYYCIGLKDVRMGNGVLFMDRGAFSYCRNLESIVLPDSLSSISDSLFYDCVRLTHVTLPNALYSIGELAFAYTNIDHIVLPNTLNVVGYGAFQSCISLHTITMPAIFDRMDVSTFRFCSSLESLRMTGDVSSFYFDGSMFSTCSEGIAFESGNDGYALRAIADSTRCELKGADLVAYKGVVIAEWTMLRDSSHFVSISLAMFVILLITLAIVSMVRKR